MMRRWPPSRRGSIREARPPDRDALAEWWPTCPDMDRRTATDALKALAAHTEPGREGEARESFFGIRDGGALSERRLATAAVEG